jgi:hypothetical protein
MTVEEWFSIKKGDTIYSARTGKPRKVLDADNGNITLLKYGSMTGQTTVYCRGDKICFKLNTKETSTDNSIYDLSDMD